MEGSTQISLYLQIGRVKSDVMYSDAMFVYFDNASTSTRHQVF